MNWLDILIIIILAGSAVGGLANGFIKSLFSFIGVILGIWLAGHFYPDLAQALAFIPNDTTAKIAAFAIIFLAILIIFSLLGIFFTKLVSALLLGCLNRLLGMVFGVLVCALVVAACLAVIVHFLGYWQAITDSAIAGFLLDKFPLVLALLPDEFQIIKGIFH